MTLLFTPASKTTVVGDGITEDSVWFRDLPVPTHMHTLQLPSPALGSFPGASNDWDEFAGEFEASFNPPGDYLFVLSADGYETYSVVITATDTPTEG